MITLTPEQGAAVEAVRDWYQTSGHTFGAYSPPTLADEDRWPFAPDRPQRARIEMPPFRLFGPAGTGKTTLVRHIPEALGLRNVVFGAFTGKAAQVLRSKDVPATTIHSAIYRPTGNRDIRMKLDEAQRELADIMVELMGDAEMARKDELTAEIERLEEILRQPAWSLNPDSDWAYADLIVLDEVSMVTEKMARDIESFGVPVLVLGDPFQLPPVGGEGYYTNVKPDILLTEIHRQALESPVLRMATEIRLGKEFDGVRQYLPENYEAASVSRALAHEQAICWRNATRWKLTRLMRKKVGRPDGTPVAGDRVMCLTNNKDLGIFNGQQFDVTEAKPAWLDPQTGAVDTYSLMVRECGEPEGTESEIMAYAAGFTEATEPDLKQARAFRGQVGAFTFANAITCHKAQGSQYESVYVIDETAAMIASSTRREGVMAATENARRWLYTAISRASESVTLARLKS